MRDCGAIRGPGRTPVGWSQERKWGSPASSGAIEEGLAALVCSYAARHDYFENVRHVGHELLKTIGQVVGHLKVSVHRAADWERPILVGYEAWRRLREAGGGRVELDIDRQTPNGAVTAGGRPMCHIGAWDR